jgi:5-oxoprolinase (ATP-hydrolysing)/N-methylhydantoinase A
MPPLSLWQASPASGGPDGLVTRRACFEGQWMEAPVVARHALAPGRAVRGPAIVEENEATTVVPPGWTVELGDAWTLRLRRGTP